MTGLLAATHAGHLALPHIAYLTILPVLILLGGALVILVWSSLTRRPLDVAWVSSLTALTAAAGLITAILQFYDVQDHGPHTAIAGAVVEDGFSAFITVLVCSAVFLVATMGDTWLKQTATEGPEFHVLTLVSASGAVVMATANDLIVIFLGLEILSIALYVLAAFNARRSESGEAALKYFVLGAFSSAIFLYGIALVYGAVGSTNLPQIAGYLAHNVLLHNGLLLGGIALLLVGFGFKVAAVPFHLWTPDVYQGSPTPVTGFMAAVAKAGGFAALLRVMISSFGPLRADWQPAVWVIAALTLLVGAFVALVQRDVKRMMAYSSINHAGFILLGVQAADGRGVSGAAYYLFVYSIMVIGSFAVISVVGGPDDDRHDLENYRGLFARQPWLAGSLAVLLLAQAGIPFTTGLWAKLEVVDAAVAAHSDALAVIAMVSAVVAGFFYLRVVFLMLWTGRAVGDDGVGGDAAFPEPAGDEGSAPVGAGAAGRGAAVPGVVAVATGEAGSVSLEAVGPAAPEGPGGEAPAGHVPIPAGVAFTIALSVGVTVLFGIIPTWLTDFAGHATLLGHP